MFLLHIAIIGLYSAAAITAAILVPGRIPAISPQSAPLVGGFVFMMAAFVHFAAVQGARHRVTRGRLSTMHEAFGRLSDDVDLVYNQSSQLRDAMVESSKREAKRVSDMVAEVRLLQGLIEKFSRKAQPALAAAASSSVVEEPENILPIPPQSMVKKPRPDMPAVAENIDEERALRILREGLRLDRVDVYLQPVVSLPQRKTRYYECFTRIRDDEGAVLLPDQYIELARREGLVTAIDNMQLFRCVQLIRRTQKRKFNTLFFCNISHDSLADAEFFDDFIDFVAENDDLSSMLVFEFRQADIQDADGDLLRKLGRLADLGFRFSLDGVTHFNMNFTALATAEFRFLRLDAALLLDQLGQDDSEVDVRDLKRRLDREGIDLIVQKIEKEEDLRELLDFNIDFGQGYLFGEPRLSRDD